MIWTIYTTRNYVAKLTFTLLLFFDTIKEYQMFQTKDETPWTINMEAAKRPADNGSNGDSTDAKKAHSAGEDG